MRKEKRSFEKEARFAAVLFFDCEWDGMEWSDVCMYILTIMAFDPPPPKKTNKTKTLWGKGCANSEVRSSVFVSAMRKEVFRTEINSIESMGYEGFEALLDC